MTFWQAFGRLLISKTLWGSLYLWGVIAVAVVGIVTAEDPLRRACILIPLVLAFIFVVCAGGTWVGLKLKEKENNGAD